MTNRNVWIFQSSPNKYKIGEALKELAPKTWLVNQHRNEIQKGDIILIWFSGKERGIYGIGKVTSYPSMCEESKRDSSFWIKNISEKVCCRVGIEIEQIMLSNPILADELIFAGLEDLKVLIMPRGTNFYVSPSQWEKIKALVIRRLDLLTRT